MTVKMRIGKNINGPADNLGNHKLEQIHHNHAKDARSNLS
jgi:hypothetical protein